MRLKKAGNSEPITIITAVTRPVIRTASRTREASYLPTTRFITKPKGITTKLQPIKFTDGLLDLLNKYIPRKQEAK